MLRGPDGEEAPVSRATLDLTPEAVAAVLTRAGFEAARMGADSYRPVIEGFHAYLVPVTHEDRVGVSWHSGSANDAWIHSPHPNLASCAAWLEAAGYQVEFVADIPAGDLVVWVDGEF